MRNLARELGFILAVIGFAIVASPAFAQQSGMTQWVCWYNNDMTVRCVLQAPAADSDAAERAVKIAQPTPEARPLPAHVREIIRAEEALLDAEVSIPMFNHPEEGGEMMEQLASFSVCFGKPDCQMTFWRPIDVVALAD
ncbi:MAG: hypothetical protein KDG55_14230 [Rhodocyclaceae bacterium]|nr:hypothetical protein [Rhodocyclaceae bacterium]